MAGGTPLPDIEAAEGNSPLPGLSAQFFANKRGRGSTGYVSQHTCMLPRPRVPPIECPVHGPTPACCVRLAYLAGSVPVLLATDQPALCAEFDERLLP